MEQLVAAAITWGASACLFRAALRAKSQIGSRSWLPLKGRWAKLAVAGLVAGLGLIILFPLNFDFGLVSIQTPCPVIYSPSAFPSPPPQGLSFDGRPPFWRWTLYIHDWEGEIRVLQPGPSAR